MHRHPTVKVRGAGANRTEASSSGFSTFVSFQNLWTFLPKTRLFSRESPRIFEQTWRRGSKKGEGEEKRGNTHRRKGESVARDVKKQQGRKTNKACRWQTLSILRWEDFSEKKEDEWPVSVFIGKGRSRHSGSTPGRTMREFCRT